MSFLYYLQLHKQTKGVVPICSLLVLS